MSLLGIERGNGQLRAMIRFGVFRTIYPWN